VRVVRGVVDHIFCQRTHAPVLNLKLFLFIFAHDVVFLAKKSPKVTQRQMLALRAIFLVFVRIGVMQLSVKILSVKYVIASDSEIPLEPSEVSIMATVESSMKDF
jgi:hypothetical protein